MEFETYQAKLLNGNILTFYAQQNQITELQGMLKENNGDRWWVGIPLVLEGYTEEYENPLPHDVSQGTGISISCTDPVAALKYLDFLCKEEMQIKKYWGFAGQDYIVNSEGYFYRTQEQLMKWQDSNWKDITFGQTYWIEMVNFDPCSMHYLGKNAVSPENQPSIFYDNFLDTEKEVLEAYGKESWFDFFNKPDISRAKYSPMLPVKIPESSDEDIVIQKIEIIRKKYIPLIITAEKDKFDYMWKRYRTELHNIAENIDMLIQFYQIELDARVEQAGGY